MSSGKGDSTLDTFASFIRGLVNAHNCDVNSVKFSFKLPSAGHPQHHFNGDGLDESFRFCVVN